MVGQTGCLAFPCAMTSRWETGQPEGWIPVSGKEKRPGYRAFLLRLWRESGREPGQTTTWRCSIEDPHTGRQRAFGGLESLVSFLRAEIDQSETSATLDEDRR
jgi:hypothetical protein